MVRYNLFPLVTAVAVLAFLSCQVASADNAFGGIDLYGFPMGIVPPGSRPTSNRRSSAAMRAMSART